MYLHALSPNFLDFGEWWISHSMPSEYKVAYQTFFVAKLILLANGGNYTASLYYA